MLTAYIKAAMYRAKYEILEDDGTFYGSIPDCQGMWANADTLEEAHDELQELCCPSSINITAIEINCANLLSNVTPDTLVLQTSVTSTHGLY